MSRNPGAQQGLQAGHGGLSGRSSSLGSMYRALDDYEQKARQRKYMIAEYEDTVENLQKELKEVTEKNKALEAECEKLEIGAQAAEANYEKEAKEKVLLENKYRELAQEMDEVSTEMGRKQGRLKQIKLFHEQKMEQFKKTGEDYMNEYMKNPRIAEIVECSRKNDELQAVLKEKNLELQRRKREQQDLIKKHNEEWEKFKGKCVKLAEMYPDLKRKKEVRNNLRAKYEASLRSPTRSQKPRIQMTPNMNKENQPSSSPSPRSPLLNIQNKVERLGSKIGLAAPRQRRTSAFQKLDRMLCSSNNVAGSYIERRTSVIAPMEGGINAWKKLCSPISTGSTLVSQLRSKLKGTVTVVHPMPRNQDGQQENFPSQNQIANFAATTTTPMRKETAAAHIIPPCPPELVSSTNEQIKAYQPPQESVNILQAEPMEMPPPPPPQPSQQRALSTSEKMDVNEFESDIQVLRSDHINVGLDKTNDIEMANFSKSSEQETSAITDDPSPMMSQPSSLPFFTPSKSPEDSIFGGFGPTSSSGSGGDDGFFTNFFDTTSSQTQKSPEFPGFGGFF